MTITMRMGGEPNDLLRKVEALSSQNLADCYQCGTCAASCPLRRSMDLLPDTLILHLRFGMPGILDRRAFWICVGCDGCVEHCPRAIDVSKVMAALRQISLQENGDHLSVAQLPETALRKLPTIALVANMRRHTG